MKDRVIEAGDRFDAYQDGKGSPSCLAVVVVDAVLKREDVNNKYLKMWKKAINDDFKESLIDRFIHYVEGPQQFWDWNCDTFIFGHILNDKETVKDPMMFAKRPRGWYGVNWNYMLDVGGKIRRRNMKTWRQCADEMGCTMKWNKERGRFDYYDKKTGKLKAV